MRGRCVTSHAFAMAVINLAVDELLREGYTLPQIIQALEDYTKAAKIAAEQQGQRH